MHGSMLGQHVAQVATRFNTCGLRNCRVLQLEMERAGPPRWWRKLMPSIVHIFTAHLSVTH